MSDDDLLRIQVFIQGWIKPPIQLQSTLLIFAGVINYEDNSWISYYAAFLISIPCAQSYLSSRIIRPSLAPYATRRSI